MLKSHHQLYSKAICESLHVYAATNATLHDFFLQFNVFWRGKKQTKTNKRPVQFRRIHHNNHADYTAAAQFALF